MTRAIIFSVVDCLFVFGALVWLDVSWPVAAVTALFAGLCTAAALVLVRRYPSKVTSRHAWKVFGLSGALGLLIVVLMLIAKMPPVIVVLEITISLIVLDCGLCLRDERAGCSETTR